MRPTAAELYEASIELQSSAAAYVQGLETENRALRRILFKVRAGLEEDLRNRGWLRDVDDALAAEPAAGEEDEKNDR